jgi:diguanylate cyclase (GGDEF)-like protein/PAS domain S-box-containing protein
MGLREFENLLHTDPRYGELEAEVQADGDRRLTAGTLGIVAFGLLVLIIPVEMNQAIRYSIGFFLICVWGPADVVLSRRFAGFRVDLIYIVLDLFLAGVASWLVPVLWVPCLVIATVIVVAAIPMHRRSVIVGLCLYTCLAYGGSGLVFEVEGWYLALAAFITVLPGYDAYYRASQRRAAATLRRYNALIDAAAVFFWEVDLQTGAFVSVAGNLRPIVGYSPAEFLQMRWQDIVPDVERRRLMELPMLEVGAERALVTKMHHREGHSISVRHSVRRTDDGVLRGVSSDINDLAEAAETIQFQAEHDALTGLYNRSVLAERLERAAKTMSADAPIAVLMLDLNRFKEVNDTLGHPVGDELLKILAERFSEALPDAEVVARLGGDEFAVLLTKDVTRAAALDAARRIAGAAERKLEIDRLKLSVSASIGVVLGPEHGATADEMLRHADIAMYAAKRKGEPVEVFQSMPEAFSLERLQLSAAIGPALDTKQLELWYQPKMCLESRTVVGAEALVRWRHPERGILFPADFLELIGLAGEYHRFTDQVLEEGIAAAARCRDEGHAIEMAVNLSILSFFDQRLPSRLADQLDANSVMPSQFTLEVTEADMLDDAGSHSGVFSKLQELGVGISIDDFGTGHSSLVRLKELPVTELKLDRSFVSRLDVDSQDRIIVQTVVNLAAALGLRTVAEGVESEATESILRASGCQAAQGYLYAKPMPIDDFVTFLDRWEPGTEPWVTSTSVARSI